MTAAAPFFPVTHDGSFSDARGTVPIAVTNDGTSFGTEIHGVSFSGPDFDYLAPVEPAATASPDGFDLTDGCLGAGTLSVVIPVPVVADGAETPGRLTMTLALGLQLPTRQQHPERLDLALEWRGGTVRSRGKSGWFEGELLDIEKQLPSGTYIKSCFFCLYADYSPYGHGLFGWMMCFRKHKAAYLRVRSKDGFWRVHDRAEVGIQETFLCDEFVRRKAGTGYRG
jgi:hypothetical protein